MIRINLLPVKAEQRKETVKRQLMYATFGVVVVAAVCGWSYISVGTQLSALEDDTEILQGEIIRLKKVIGQVEEFKVAKTELKKKIEVIEKLKRDRTGPVHLLDEIAQAVPEKAWVTNIAEKGNKVNIVGQAVNWESIADFTEKLRRSEHIAKVEVGPTKRIQSDDLYLQEFLLIAHQTGDSEPTTSRRDRRKKKD